MMQPMGTLRSWRSAGRTGIESSFCLFTSPKSDPGGIDVHLLVQPCVVEFERPAVRPHEGSFYLAWPLGDGEGQIALAKVDDGRHLGRAAC
jgi:hypothetical protein